MGCIGCPIASKRRWREFADFPTYKAAYIRAFDVMLERLKEKWKTKQPKWKSGYDVFLWWMEDENVEGQINMFDDGFMGKE